MQTPEDNVARPDTAPVVNVDDHTVAEAPVDTVPAPVFDAPGHDEDAGSRSEVAETGKTSELLVASPVIEVRDLDWQAVRSAANPAAIRARMHTAIEQMEKLLDKSGGPGMLFDTDREGDADRAIRVSMPASGGPLWIIGDLHGDLPALEAALAQIRNQAAIEGNAAPRIIFLGDFFDDEGYGLEVLLRVFELIVSAPELVCVIAGNHDEALSYDGVRFASSVSPSDFTDFLNANLAHEWIERAGKLVVRLTARSPRALFFPDGLLVAHGGFPLTDLHPRLDETGDWNDPACLSDFVWSRAHPKARRKMPNRFSRGSQFGYLDFADFCALSARLGRRVTHMVRGHDHVQERYAVYPAYEAHPLLTTVALSRRLNREQFGPYERVPSLVRVVEGALPQIFQLHIPGDMINEFFPQPENGAPPGTLDSGDPQQ
ncbi:metallophosphoesterase [Noviherbaspirillum sp. L7-7A]|uniref:metallophosphoesterase n=1 Tax=Noviherbaspirillum sp. L7-7A TaxID=2850560 RepID=UPI001C2C754D|nr:metallophosphoesterase [Noviherbaspirillum sp. L7-7A]MBV0882077.1 metallophosphoesterase [Noviherbaspirillum sp. L7-7A]